MQEMDAVRRHERGAGPGTEKFGVRTLGSPHAAGGRPGPTYSVAALCGERLVTLRPTAKGPTLRQCSGLAERPLLLPLSAPSGVVLAHRVPGASRLKEATAMASASITTRKTEGGAWRYAVRFRLGGHAYPVEHGGSFSTMKEARARRDFIAGELAAGRNPADALGASTERPRVGGSYEKSRFDVGERTRAVIRSHFKKILRAFENRDPATITPADVQEWSRAPKWRPPPSSVGSLLPRHAARGDRAEPIRGGSNAVKCCPRVVPVWSSSPKCAAKAHESARRRTLPGNVSFAPRQSHVFGLPPAMVSCPSAVGRSIQ
jgi:hypothetical protein